MTSKKIPPSKLKQNPIKARRVQQAREMIENLLVSKDDGKTYRHAYISDDGGKTYRESNENDPIVPVDDDPQSPEPEDFAAAARNESWATSDDTRRFQLAQAEKLLRLYRAEKAAKGDA